MIKKYLKKCIFVLILLLFPTIIFAEDLEINSKYALVYNLNDDEILYEKNSDEKIYVASLTKVMTAIVAIENIKDTNENVKFPKVNVSYDFSMVGFKTNQVVTYSDLLYSLLLPSAADAAEGLAKLISGSTDEFVKLMNNKAKSLGMDNTHFSNTYGDDPNNYSTITDLLILMKYALKNDTFYKIFTTKEYTLSNKQIIRSSVYYYSKSSNIDTSAIVGSKTGFTSKAGYCFISIYNSGEMNYLIITAKADYTTKKPLHILDSLNTGKYISENYEYKVFLNNGDILTNVKAFGISFPIYSNKEIKKYINKEIEVSSKYKGSNKISLSTKAGDKIGEYVVNYGDNILIENVYIPDNFKTKLLLFIYKLLYIHFKFLKYLLIY